MLVRSFQPQPIVGLELPRTRNHLGAWRPFALVLMLGLTVATSAEPLTTAAPPTDSTPSAISASSDPVTVAQLIATARSNHPTVAAVKAASEAAQARVNQAGAWANPEFEWSLGRTNPRIDEVERDRPFGGSLKQRLEWWGKRSGRIDAAQARMNSAEADAGVALLELDAAVQLAAIAYADAVAATSEADHEATLANEFLNITTTRQTAGDTGRGEVARAKLDASTATLRSERCRRQIATTLDTLRIWCGADLPLGLVVSDAVAHSDKSVDAKKLTTHLAKHPRLRALIETRTAAQSQLGVEQQARMPDVTVGVFGEREYDKDTYGVTLGIELPIWNRNHAVIAEARAEHDAAEAQVRVEILRLQRELNEAVNDVLAANSEADALTTQALPLANELLALRLSAFRAGEASLADCLEARRAALAVHTSLREARRRHAEASVRLGLAVGDLAMENLP